MKHRSFLIACLLWGISLSACARPLPPASPEIDITNIHEPENTELAPTPTLDPAFHGPAGAYVFTPPAGWEHTSRSEKFLEVDTFTSPDGYAAIEGMIYNDGQPFDGVKIREFAIYLLNTYYSINGQGGDVQIVSEQMTENGGNRIDWKSRNGGYSGWSYYQIHGADQTSFLFFTARWMDGIGQEIMDVIGQSENSYQSKRD